MRDAFYYYFAHLLDGYPILVIVIVVAYTLAVFAWGLFKNWRQAWGLLALGYAVLILYVTVFSRPSNSYLAYNLHPFYSYYQIENGDDYLLPQVIMNIVVFVPVGFLTRAAFEEWGLGKTIACGVLLSVVVETLQFVLLKGMAELDDVIHNTLGTIIGVAVCNLLISCKRELKHCL